MNAQDIFNSQDQTMQFNAMEAQKARDGQERMYKNRYQIAVNDIKKAGLNPYILNQFSPGGFSSGTAAQIASNIHHNTNKNEPNLNIASGLMPIIGGVIGSFFGGAGATIGSGLGHLAARFIAKKHK